jgi:hypothetical protein
VRNGIEMGGCNCGLGTLVAPAWSRLGGGSSDNKPGEPGSIVILGTTVIKFPLGDKGPRESRLRESQGP